MANHSNRQLDYVKRVPRFLEKIIAENPVLQADRSSKIKSHRNSLSDDEEARRRRLPDFNDEMPVMIDSEGNEIPDEIIVKDEKTSLIIEEEEEADESKAKRLKKTDALVKPVRETFSRNLKSDARLLSFDNDE